MTSTRTRRQSRGWRLVLVALVSVTFGLASARAGDCGFGFRLGGGVKSGTTFHDITGRDDWVSEIAVQPWDGKIIVAGTINGDWSVTRYEEDGSMDETFGVDGTVILDFDGGDDRVESVFVVTQPRRRIIVAGTAEDGGDEDFAIARLSPSGVLAPEFGNGGIVITGFGAEDQVREAAMARGGRIILAGRHFDDELFRLASEKRLHRPKILREQVTRMLRDPKAEALVENFAVQWLGLDRVSDIAPDPTVLKSWDEELRRSMRLESEAFFRHVLAENLSVVSFLDSDFAFLNQRLARHYDIPGVKGADVRKVDLKGEWHRGGLLTQAGILAVNSQPTRSSPIFRGKFVVEKLFNRPPPNPPANVPPLTDDGGATTPESLRDKLALHAEDPRCSSCHAKIDPWGIALESYDGVGAWRDVAKENITSILESGEEIVGPRELKRELTKRKDDFLRGLAEKMMLYALGRTLNVFDKKHLPAIEESVQADGYRFHRLVESIVLSRPFLSR
jgi:uncharacterized delta-60 repeat protein